MAVLNIELSEYDAMRNRNKELEERIKQLEKELEGCKNGSRVIIRKVMDKKEVSRFIGYDHLLGEPRYSNEQIKEVVVSENYINFEDVRLKVEDKMKEAIESSIKYHNEAAYGFDRKEESLDAEYSKKRDELVREYEQKKDELDKKFESDTKKVREERDKYRKEAFDKSQRTQAFKENINRLATDALERLESMWFKPSHAISLVREISNRTK